MSIETLLTLGLTVALLIAAFLLRLVILGLLRLGLRLAGRDTSWTRPPVSDRTASREAGAQRLRRIRQRRPFWTPERVPALRSRLAGAKTKAGPAVERAGVALGAAGATLLAMAATAWRAMTRGADSLERWADRTSERLEPAVHDFTSAARRSTADMRKWAVMGIATIQHVLLLLIGWVRDAWAAARSSDEDQQRASSAPTSPGPTKVIDLDAELGDDDPLESTSPSTKSHIGV
ncbi:MAG: hypothetical protein ACLGIB_00255 [Actinomycetota bacterium]